MTSVPHGFGQVLRDHRLAAGLTQEALAERAGLSVRGLSDLERGLRHNPRPETVRRLTDALALQGEARAGFESSARRASPSRLLPPQPHSASARSTLNLPGAALAMPLEALAQIGVAGNQPRLAFRLAGAASAYRQSAASEMAPSARHQLERWLSPARAALGDSVANAEYEAGQALTPEQAIATAMALADSVAASVPKASSPVAWVIATSLPGPHAQPVVVSSGPIHAYEHRESNV